MAVIEDFGDNRPPPKKKRSLNITTPGIPWYRDIRVLRIIAQVIFVILFVGGGAFLINNLVTNLNASSLSMNFGIFERPFTVAISEGPSMTSEWGWLNNVNVIELTIPLINSDVNINSEGVIWLIYAGLIAYIGYTIFKRYQKNTLTFVYPLLLGFLVLLVIFFPPSEILSFLSRYFFPSSMTRAFFTGIANTLRVVVLSLFACTILGIFVGIGLLSSNFLVRTVSQIFVEIFRNTPLLIQLLFIYRSLTLLLPFPRESICMTGECTGQNFYAINARGIYLVSPQFTDATNYFWFGVLVAFILVVVIRRLRLKEQELTGKPAKILQTTIPIFLAIVVISYLLANFAGSVSTLDFPTLQGRNIGGGTQLTLGFFALFLGLTLYTAAFIADIVRAGIQAVPHGQIEAARAQGLSGGQVLNLVILPQALRLIIPPLGNQYVNLGKNSSLGIAVNYAETFRIAQIANNESGQAVPFFVGLMIIYLVLSLTLSVMTNLVNRSTQLRAR